MTVRQRGNAILISTILVFALTVTALGVSRLLVKGTQQMTTQREFLGLQAHALAEAAIYGWLQRTDRPTPLSLSYTITVAGTPSALAANVTVTVAASGTTPTFDLIAAASLVGTDQATVSRAIQARANCPNPPPSDCLAAKPVFGQGYTP